MSAIGSQVFVTVFRGSCLILCLCTAVFLRAQNLVPNPGFDDLTGCPDDEGQIELIPPWHKILTPDLYSACATNIYFSVPMPGACGHIPAHNGDNYVGLYVYGVGPREYIETELTEYLTAGEMYYFGFYVRPDEDCILGQTLQTFSDAIAMAVYNDAGEYSIVAEHVGEVLRDTSTWTKVSGCYLARGGESQIRLGNFYTNQETLLEAIPDNMDVYFNYMFLDDISVFHISRLPDTMLLCPGTTLTLDVTFPDAQYLWNTGDQTSTIEVDSEGEFSVIRTLDACTIRDTVLVVPLEDPAELPDVIICEDRNATLSAHYPGTYAWSTGAMTQQIEAALPGVYSVTVTNPCGEFIFTQQVAVEECKCHIFVPNVFSPNHDDVNDVLNVYVNCEYPYTLRTFVVFDRWGNVVYTTTDPENDSWSGKRSGEDQAPGVYTWSLTYDLDSNGERRTISESGSVTLIR